MVRRAPRRGLAQARTGDRGRASRASRRRRRRAGAPAGRLRPARRSARGAAPCAAAPRPPAPAGCSARRLAPRQQQVGGGEHLPLARALPQPADARPVERGRRVEPHRPRHARPRQQQRRRRARDDHRASVGASRAAARRAARPSTRSMTVIWRRSLPVAPKRTRTIRQLAPASSISVGERVVGAPQAERGAEREEGDVGISDSPPGTCAACRCPAMPPHVTARRGIRPTSGGPLTGRGLSHAVEGHAPRPTRARASSRRGAGRRGSGSYERLGGATCSRPTTRSTPRCTDRPVRRPARRRCPRVCRTPVVDEARGRPRRAPTAADAREHVGQRRTGRRLVTARRRVGLDETTALRELRGRCGAVAP